MLSKEECLLKYNALKNLSDYPILCGTENDENLEPTPFNELFKEELECFEQIINEHFELKEHYDYLNLKVIEQNMIEMNYLLDRSNQPLKFEDFIEDMDTIEHIYCNHEHEEHDFKKFMKCISNVYEYVEQLEKNPPLKFKELKEGMWVWDNKRKEWCKYIGSYVFEYLDSYDSGKFEETRFFLKEVKEKC